MTATIRTGTIELSDRCYEWVSFAYTLGGTQSRRKSATDLDGFTIMGRWRVKEFNPYRITKK
jgi:hypothetical protein